MRGLERYVAVFLLMIVPTSAVAEDPAAPPEPGLEDTSSSTEEEAANETSDTSQTEDSDVAPPAPPSDDVEEAEEVEESVDNVTYEGDEVLEQPSESGRDSSGLSATPGSAAATLDAVLKAADACTSLVGESGLSRGEGLEESQAGGRGQDGSGNDIGASRKSAPLVVAPVEGFGFDWLFGAALVGLAFGAGSVALSRRRRPDVAISLTSDQQPKEIPAIPAPTVSLTDLAKHVQDQPLDAAGQFAIGVEFLRNGDVARGIRHLELSVRMDPAGLLVILENDDFGDVKGHPDVRRFLRRYYDEQQRRLWSGYA